MKVKDGFKFGVGFFIAYDLYKSLVCLISKANKRLHKYVDENREQRTQETSNHRESFPTCKNKIGFTIE